jgi:hypothetical protein
MIMKTILSWERSDLFIFEAGAREDVSQENTGCDVHKTGYDIFSEVGVKPQPYINR